MSKTSIVLVVSERYRGLANSGSPEELTLKNLKPASTCSSASVSSSEGGCPRLLSFVFAAWTLARTVDILRDMSANGSGILAKDVGDWELQLTKVPPK